MSYIVEKEKWSSFSKRLPAVAVVGLMGEWMTIYACLQQAIKNFDFVIVVGDGVSEKAEQKFDQFISDHKTLCEGRVSFYDLDELDPWPWLRFTRDKNVPESVEDIPAKCWSKAGFKRFNLARALFPNSLLFSLHSDVVVFSDSRDRMLKRLAEMENPLFDSEWFSMVSAYDFDNVAGILDPSSCPGNLIKHRDLRQRTVYDYPGDWGLMGYYASSLLSVGPDPQGAVAECFYPWNRKTQCEKKGFDTSEPHAVHFEWLRDRNIDKSYRDVLWKTIKISKDAPEDINLISRFNALKEECYFPVSFLLDENGILRIKES